MLVNSLVWSILSPLNSHSMLVNCLYRANLFACLRACLRCCTQQASLTSLRLRETVHGVCQRECLCIGR